VRFVAANPNRNATDREMMDGFAVLTFGIVVGAFCGFLLWVVISFAYFSHWRTEELHLWLGVAEAGFGALLSIVWERLFGAVPGVRAQHAAGG
jgi:NhaP-type Na+/H+ or K+/H+ antiporter